MKKYLPLILLGFLFFAPKASAAGYQYYRAVTVTSTTSIASGTNSNFPMLFGGTYTWLEASSSGGRIQNLVTAPNGGQEPADLIFVTSTPSASGGLWSCGTSLNFETESYVSSTGVINDWINVPSETAGTVLYACYGNSSVTTDQSHPSSTWNSNFLGVWHLPNGTTLSANDSTINGNNGTVNASATAVAGQIDGGAHVFRSSGTDNNITVGTGNSLNITNGILTINLWAKRNFIDASGIIFDRGVGGGYSFTLQNTSSSAIAYFFPTVAGGSFGTAPVDLNWHEYTIVSSSSSMTLYVDGVATAGVAGAPGSFVSQPGQLATLLTGGSNNTDNDFDIDEERISSAALSPPWILTEYNNESSPSTFYAIGSEQTAGGGGGNGTGTPEFYIVGILKLIGSLFLR